MQSNWKLIARRTSISIAFAALAVGVGLYIIQRQWNLYMQIALGLFVIGLALFVALDPGKIRKALTGRQARYGSNALIITVAFLGILVVVNFLANKYTKRWDLTENQSNTLAKESIDVLKSLQNNVVAKAFFTTSSGVTSSKDSAKLLLDKFVYESSGKFEYQFVDPNKDPIAAQEAGITKDGSIVLYMGNSKQPVASISESDVTGAMIRLMNPGTHVIYFLTGHGEYDIQGGGDQSYTQLATDLGSKNYKVSTLNLISTNQIPQDTSVIVIAGPKKPLLDAEVSMLDTYLKNGGSLVVMEDPTIVNQFGDSPDPLATDLAQNYGIDLGNDVVIDYSGYQQYGNALFALDAQYASHAITQNMMTQATGFLISRSVSANDAIGTDYSKTQLVLTSDGSWGETDMTSIQNNSSPTYDQGVDITGPIPLAVAATGTTSNARLVVFGNSEFASNSGYSWFGNGTLILNSVDWAAKVENLINLTPKTSVDRTLVIPKAYTINLIFLGSLIALPGLILLAGVGTWVARQEARIKPMVRRSTWIVLGLFILLVGFAVIFERYQANKTDIATPSTPTVAAVMLYDVTIAQVNEINLAAASGEKIGLYRDPIGSNWAITGVPVDQADSVQIDSISAQLLSLQVQETFTQSLSLDSIGLVAPAYMITMTTVDGEQILTYIGSANAVGNGYYVRVDSGPVVLVDKVVMDEVIGFLTNPPLLPTPTPEVTATTTVNPTESGGQVTPTP